MKRMLELVLALAVIVGMSMPTVAQEKGKAEAKKDAAATEKKAGQEGEVKKSDTAKKQEATKDAKDAKKDAAKKKGAKKGAKKDEKKS
jgi:hypothetical protein